MRYVLALDVGGTNLKAGAVTPTGKILARAAAETLAAAGRAAMLARIAGLLRGLRDEVGPRGLIGAGVGCPGPVDRRRGVVLFAPNLPDWKNVPLGAIVGKAVGCPVVVENDANAAALGEYWLGAGSGYHSLVFLTLGTGIGGGIVLDGKAWQGHTGNAGEVGHVTVDPEGVRCGCGNRGCLETIASAKGTVRRMVEALRSGRRSRLRRKDGDYQALTARDIHAAAKEGDRLSVEILAGTGRTLGLVISGLANVINPQAFILGGRMARAGRFILGPLREEVRRRALRPAWERLVVRTARLGEDAGILGAAKTALDALRL